jgi:hypothetical protein
MKSFASTLFLAFVFVFSLSTSVIAEGDIPHGGRTCQPNTTCLVDTQEAATQAEEPTVIKTVIDYLAQLFS